MKSVDLQKAKLQFLSLLARVEKRGERIIICRDGKPVADLIPHKPNNRIRPHPQLRKVKFNYDPIESHTHEEWPSDEN